MAGKAGSGANGSTLAPPAAEKAKRKRSGCLTCRDRHISCDEKFLPDCGNCRKSNRECVRGTRLNFHQIDVKDPPYLLPRAAEWSGALFTFFAILATSSGSNSQHKPVEDGITKQVTRV